MWVIAIGNNGEYLNVTRTAGRDEGKRARGVVLNIPRRKRRTSAADPDFLVDKSEYVLGVEPEGKRSADDLRKCLGLFQRYVREGSETTGSHALLAVTRFLADDLERSRAIERTSAEGYASNDLFAFEHDGRLVHELPEVQEYFSRSRRIAGNHQSQCLVCGSHAVPADNHSAVKIPGGTTSGISLVSFNADAFESYGLSRNENAPVCRDCADAYVTALNRLLTNSYPNPRRPGEVMPKRFVRLSPDTTAVFWADKEASVLDLLTDLNTPRIESVRALLLAPYEGRTPVEVSARFYCLILSGAQGRAILRGMHTGTVAHVESNVRAYFESIDTGSDQPLPLFALMRSLVLQGKLENLAPGLVTDVFVAIVFARRFPQTLLAGAVTRCRAERKVSRERAALLRAYLKRNCNLEVLVSLDRENVSPGYRLGRLMAVLESLQSRAQKNPNKTIVDRYYGAGSTRPATVFPRLVALAQHHLAKLTVGPMSFYQSRLGEVMDGIASFPPTLGLEEQGLFALGYYHQRQEFFRKSEAAPADADAQVEEEEKA